MTGQFTTDPERGALDTARIEAWAREERARVVAELLRALFAWRPGRAGGFGAGRPAAL